MSIIGGIDLGNLTDYLLFYADANVDANWQGATKGFVGDVGVDGIQASERTSGSVPYAGTIYTNDATLGAWQAIINQNLIQASGVTGEVVRIAGLEADLISALQQINALAPTPGYASVASTSLNGLNTQNGIPEVFVINITSGLNFSSQINITGDAEDVFILRWDTDGDPTNGYQGQVKPQSGGAIVPLGGLTAGNFINVAGDINASGGGSTPPPPYPQGPRFNDGQGSLIVGGSDFSGGGFFTGYWLTTGSPDIFDPGTGLYYGETSSLSNGIFVGGWYSLTTKFSMTSGTSGVYVSPNPATIDQPAIDVEKEVSPDNGATWFDADAAPGPNIPQGTSPQFRFTVTNTGNVTLTNVQVTDDVYGVIGTVPSLAPGASSQWIITVAWASGQQVNTATATGDYQGQTYTDTDPAYYFGVAAAPSIDVEKEVSPDNGVTWFDADLPTGPNIPQGTSPQFRFTVTNTGTATLTNVQVTDDVYGLIGTLPSLAPGASNQWIITVAWAAGQQVNTATATGVFQGQTLTDTDPAHYFGVLPSIDVEKEVSPDNGVTWFDADVAPGPSILQGTNPQFRFTVTNTGNVTMTNIQVTDDVFGLIGTLPSLAPGVSNQWIIVGVWAPGQQVNTATGTGDYQGQTYTDTDPAYYLGILPVSSIDVEKEVSPDNGVTWFDADAPTGPNIPQGTSPQFRFTVINNGNSVLTNVTVTDNVYGPIGIVPILAPGASNQWIITVAWLAGQQLDIATATGTDPAGAAITDIDPAHYFGVVPSIDVEKEVSPDNGVTWLDADAAPGPSIPQGTSPQFRFTVTNNGNATLTNVQVTDDVYGLIGTLPSLAPGVSNQWIITVPWAVGQQVNTATATGVFAGQTYTDTDPAHYFGVIPSIDVEKEVSPDNGVTWFDADAAPGPNIMQGTSPQFRFTVTNTGTVPLTNVTVTDNVYGPIGVVPILAPGASNQWIITVAWAAGQQVNTATAVGVYLNQTLTDSDPAHYFGVAAAPSIDVEKLISADGGITFNDADVPPGPSIPEGTDPIFRFIVSNTGNVTLTNIVLVDTVLGPIAIPTTTLDPGDSFAVTKSGTWASGQRVNIATVTGQYEGSTVTDADPAYYFGTGIAELRLVKSVDKDYVVKGDIITYTTVITNTGTIPVNNVIFKDPIPAGTSFVEGSVAIATPPGPFVPDPTADPADGIDLGTINPGQSVAVRFSVRYDFLPCPPIICNIAFAVFNYINDSSGAIQTGEAESNKLCIEAAQTNFKQLVVDEIVKIPPQKPEAEEILNTMVDVKIISTSVIKTLKGTSQEGQILTGYKLIIEGILHQKIEYIADEPTQSIHAAEFNVPFSSFIILPENFKEGSITDVKAYVEDIYVKLLDKRCIFKNITLRLEAEIIC